MNSLVSWQLETVVPSGFVHVPVKPGPSTRTLLKPVGDPVTACEVTPSPMKPAGGAAPMPCPPYVSHVRNGPIRAPRLPVKFPAMIPGVSVRHPVFGLLSRKPLASAVQVYEPYGSVIL